MGCSSAPPLSYVIKAVQYKVEGYINKPATGGHTTFSASQLGYLPNRRLRESPTTTSNVNKARKYKAKAKNFGLMAKAGRRRRDARRMQLHIICSLHAMQVACIRSVNLA